MKKFLAHELRFGHYSFLHNKFETSQDGQKKMTEFEFVR